MLGPVYVPLEWCGRHLQRLAAGWLLLRRRRGLRILLGTLNLHIRGRVSASAAHLRRRPFHGTKPTLRKPRGARATRSRRTDQVAQRQKPPQDRFSGGEPYLAAGARSRPAANRPRGASSRAAQRRHEPPTPSQERRSRVRLAAVPGHGSGGIARSKQRHSPRRKRATRYRERAAQSPAGAWPPAAGAAGQRGRGAREFPETESCLGFLLSLPLAVRPSLLRLLFPPSPLRVASERGVLVCWRDI
jgi:hypothetical protein